MTGTAPKTITVLCVDDNPHVADALRLKVARTPGLAWQGWLPSADQLFDKVVAEQPDVVLLDIDMPGRSPFEALAQIADEARDSRVLVFSGHVRRELVERAIESGAWGYISKNDGDTTLVEAIRRVATGEFVLSPEVQSVFID